MHFSLSFYQFFMLLLSFGVFFFFYPAVCWFEVFGPKVGRFRTRNLLWAADPQVTHPPTLMLPPKAFSLHTCKELFLGFVEIGPVSPDPITVCGHVKITAVIKKDRLPKGSAGSRRVWHKMLTVCFIALISKHHIIRRSSWARGNISQVSWT